MNSETSGDRTEPTMRELCTRMQAVLTRLRRADASTRAAVIGTHCGTALRLISDGGGGWLEYCAPDEGCGHNEPYGWEAYTERPEDWPLDEWAEHCTRVAAFVQHLEGALS